MQSAVPYIQLKVFHATFAGQKGDVLESFLTHGANPTLAEGYGQGAGFYVWTTLEQARAHSKWLEQLYEDNKEYPNPGLPLVIECDVMLNPEEWDVDYEMNMELIIAFLWNRWETFKKIPENTIKVLTCGETDTLSISKSEKVKGIEMFIRFILISENGVEYPIGITTKKKYNSSNTTSGALLGQIFNYLQKHAPNETNKYESQIFLKMASKKNMAIKYVGKKNLPIHSVQIQVNNEWISGEKALAYYQTKLHAA